MKILIVAQSRSGSSSLEQCIAEATGFPHMREPFNHWRLDPEQDVLKIENYKNIVVKVVDNHFYKHPRFEEEKVFFSMFDKVIGLTRDSTYQNVSSLLIASKFNSWEESSKNKIFSIKEYEKIMNDNFDFYYEKAKQIKNKIKSFDIFQTTYEELYVNDTGWDKLENYLGFKLDKTIMFSSYNGL
jgi:hypothetical protein